jgi:hypothetical protein
MVEAIFLQVYFMRGFKVPTPCGGSVSFSCGSHVPSYPQLAQFGWGCRSTSWAWDAWSVDRVVAVGRWSPCCLLL